MRILLGIVGAAAILFLVGGMVLMNSLSPKPTPTTTPAEEGSATAVIDGRVRWELAVWTNHACIIRPDEIDARIIDDAANRLISVDWHRDPSYAHIYLGPRYSSAGSTKGVWEVSYSAGGTVSSVVVVGDQATIIADLIQLETGRSSEGVIHIACTIGPGNN